MCSESKRNAAFFILQDFTEAQISVVVVYGLLYLNSLSVTMQM